MGFIVHGSFVQHFTLKAETEGPKNSCSKDNKVQLVQAQLHSMSLSLTAPRTREHT